MPNICILRIFFQKALACRNLTRLFSTPTPAGGQCCTLKSTELPQAGILPILCAIWGRNLDKSIESKSMWDHLLVYQCEHCVFFLTVEQPWIFMVPPPPSPPSRPSPQLPSCRSLYSMKQSAHSILLALWWVQGWSWHLTWSKFSVVQDTLSSWKVHPSFWWYGGWL